MRKLDLIILCGGLGKRIRSKSKNLPKILININKNKPFILYQLRMINSKYIKKVILSLGYKKQPIVKFIKDNKKFNLSYSVEKNLLGTGGAIKNTINKKIISNPFLVLNGDTYMNINIGKIIKFNHKNKVKRSLIILKEKEKGNRYDQFQIYKKKIVLNDKKDKKLFMNCGLYLFYKKDFKNKKNNFSIERDVLPNLIKKNKLDYLINRSKVFFDIGIPKDLNRFKKFINLKS
tara:strand:- start:108 stop:806 length:699 start_codon:yes stop_codon:yes gene_type:complete